MSARRLVAAAVAAEGLVRRPYRLGPAVALGALAVAGVTLALVGS